MKTRDVQEMEENKTSISNSLQRNTYSTICYVVTHVSITLISLYSIGKQNDVSTMWKVCLFRRDFSQATRASIAGEEL